MKATCDFEAVYNGQKYKLRKNGEFNGSKDAAEHFASLGLLEEKASVK